MNSQGSAPNQLTCDWLFCSMYLLSRCPALCNPMDCSLPGSSVHGIFQARILEWVAISYSRSLSSYSRTDINQNSRLNLMNSLVVSRFCHVWLFATPWTVARQAPLSMGFSRQGSWSVLLPSPSPGDLLDPGIEPTSLMSPALAGGFFTAAAAAKSLQSCPTLRDPTDGSPPGSPVPGILQARALEWVAISFTTGTTTFIKIVD